MRERDTEHNVTIKAERESLIYLFKTYESYAHIHTTAGKSQSKLCVSSDEGIFDVLMYGIFIVREAELNNLTLLQPWC